MHFFLHFFYLAVRTLVDQASGFFMFLLMNLFIEPFQVISFNHCNAKELQYRLSLYLKYNIEEHCAG